MSTFISVTLLLAKSAQSVPLMSAKDPNYFKPTGPSEPPYTPGPDTRGTVGLLVSSILTLVLCVYTAIHLNVCDERKVRIRLRLCNINGPEFRLSRESLYKFCWILIALFAPEFVLYSAYNQWQAARKLCKEVKEYGGSSYSDSFSKIYALGSGFLERAERILISRHQDESSTGESTKSGDEALFRGAPTSPSRHNPNSQLETIQPPSNLDMADTEALFPETASPPVTPQATIPDNNLNSNTESSSAGLGSEWSDITMVSAFFIVMGGFAIKSPKSDVLRCIVDRETAKDRIVLALKPKGFLELLREGYLQDPGILNTADIEDRSKSDSFAKFIVCLQALWMVFGALARKYNGLPITLLELNVIMHVIIALVVYALWFEKPQAVKRPSVLELSDPYSSSETLVPHLRFHLLATFYNHFLFKGYRSEYVTGSHWISQKGLSVDFTPCGESEGVNNSINNLTLSVAEKYKKQVNIYASEHPYTSRVGFRVYPTEASEVELRFDIATSLSLDTNACDELEEFFLTMLRLSSKRRITAGKEPRKRYVSFKEVSYSVSHSETKVDFSQVLFKTSADPPNLQIALKEDSDHFAFFLFLITLSLLYAAPHLSVWNSHFPSHLERYLWRASCIMIPGCTIVLFMGYLIYKFKRTFRPALDLINAFLQSRNCISVMCRWFFSEELLLFCGLIFMYTLFPLLVALFLSFVLARLFIVVESFISIRSLPEGSMQQVRWMNFIPHIS